MAKPYCVQIEVWLNAAINKRMWQTDVRVSFSKKRDCQIKTKSNQFDMKQWQMENDGAAKIATE